MDVADHERPSTPTPVTAPGEIEPDTAETPNAALVTLPPEAETACESGYGFGV